MNPDTQMPALRATVQLTAAVDENIFVDVGGSLPAAGGHAYGPANTAGAAGDPVAVTPLGIATAVAAAAVAKGAALEVTAAGKVQAKSGSNVVVARAMTAAAAAGDKLAVFLIPN